MAAGLKAIRQAQQAFYAVVVEDLPAAIGHNIAWQEARTRLQLRYQDQMSAVTQLEEPKSRMAANNLAN